MKIDAVFLEFDEPKASLHSLTPGLVASCPTGMFSAHVLLISLSQSRDRVRHQDAAGTPVCLCELRQKGGL